MNVAKREKNKVTCKEEPLQRVFSEALSQVVVTTSVCRW